MLEIYIVIIFESEVTMEILLLVVAKPIFFGFSNADTYVGTHNMQIVFLIPQRLWGCFITQKS